MKKKIIAPFYTIEKATISAFFKNTILPNGRLYSNGLYSTKITAEDLPDYYIQGMIYKANGYISVKGIKYIEYKPNYRVNHMHKDDFLYVSYNNPINKETLKSGYVDHTGYDALLWGDMIVKFIRAIRKYQSFDIEPIADEVKKKELFFLEKYPEESRFVSKHSLLE